MPPESVMGGQWAHLSNPEALLRSVITIIDCFKAEGLKPGSDVWESNRTAYLDFMRHRIVAEWCQDTGHPTHMFPWTDDFVVYTWIAWRKLDRLAKPKVRANLWPGKLVQTDDT